MRKAITAVLTVVAVALVGAVFAVPAFAHTPPTLTGHAVCDEETGKWVTSWDLSNGTVGNSTFTITSQTPAGTVSPTSVPQGSHATGDSTSPGSATSASLSVTGHFASESDLTVSKTVEFEGKCEAPPPPSTTSPPPEEQQSPPSQEQAQPPVESTTSVESVVVAVPVVASPQFTG